MLCIASEGNAANHYFSQFHFLWQRAYCPTVWTLSCDSAFGSSKACLQAMQKMTEWIYLGFPVQYSNSMLCVA
jgi:hypothetical protein